MIVSPICLIHSKVKSEKTLLKLLDSHLSCGFPSPADDYAQTIPSLDELLIKHPSASFLARAQGDSMIERGIINGSLLIIDRSEEAKDGSTIVASIAGELTIKIWDEKRKLLIPANRKMKPISLNEDLETICEGVVTYCISPQQHYAFAC